MTKEKKQVKIALAGNPNSGKTTLFNAMTGSRQHVGNYPGVTVDLKEGSARLGDRDFLLIDLPGTYSLAARSAEEIVARNFLIDEQPDAVIVVIDASNLERNLYLAVQLMELGVPLVLALNMWDMLEAKGLAIDSARLSALAGVPVVETVGSRRQGLDRLLQAAAEVADGPKIRSEERRQVNYGNEIEPHVERLTEMVAEHEPLRQRARWYALKLLEGDRETARRVARLAPQAEAPLTETAAEMRRHIEGICGDDVGTDLADRRYGFIAGIHAEVVSRTSADRMSSSEKVDRVVLNRWLGLPIFAAMMYLVFSLTFSFGEPLMALLENGFEWLGGAVAEWWPGGESLLLSLLADGIIGGVGGVLVFLPNILLLFLAISFLEDSGYMARAAFIMDRLMHKIGLHGRSFIPMLVGFGCTVPAIMATRTLESRRDRFTTIMVLPLISCGARLPIYMLIIPAFFPTEWHARMLWIIYVVGILLAIGGAKLLRSTLFKGESVPFVMELPPYRLPTWRGVFIHMWERSWQFLRKAGTIILGASIILWALSQWPRPEAGDLEALAEQQLELAAEREHPAADEQAALIEGKQAELNLEASLMGRLGKAVEPVMRPLGFDWKISTAMIGALVAKEVFVAQMGIVYALGEADEDSPTLRQTLQDNYTPLQGLAIMLFCLISMPCIATVAITRRETASWVWAGFQVASLTGLAWIVTFLVYQIGSLIVG